MSGIALYVVMTLWVIFMIVTGAAAIAVSLYLVYKAKLMVKAAKLTVKKIDTRSKAGFNKIASLPVSEFNSFLTTAYSAVLEVAIVKDVSARDPNNAVVLFAKSLEYMHVYLGEETIHAINYYYGVGYLDRWCKLRYQILSNGGQLANLITKYHDNTVFEQA